MIIYPDGHPDAELATHDPLQPVTPFPNLRVAGGELATALESYRNQDDVLVLAMALGGVLVGHEVAIRLGLPFDLVILRRLLAPADLGSPVCAVNVAGNLEIVGELPPRPVVPLTGVDFFIADALADLARREKVCRGGRPPCDIAGKIVLLVDCGMRTGETMRAA